MTRSCGTSPVTYVMTCNSKRHHVALVLLLPLLGAGGCLPLTTRAPSMIGRWEVRVQAAVVSHPDLPPRRAAIVRNAPESHLGGGYDDVTLEHILILLRNEDDPWNPDDLPSAPLAIDGRIRRSRFYLPGVNAVYREIHVSRIVLAPSRPTTQSPPATRDEP